MTTSFEKKFLEVCLRTDLDSSSSGGLSFGFRRPRLSLNDPPGPAAGFVVRLVNDPEEEVVRLRAMLPYALHLVISFLLLNRR